VRVHRRIEHNRRRIREDRQKCLDEEKRSLQIDRDGTIECGLVPLLDRSQIGNTCVDEQNIKAAECLTEGFGGGLLSRHITRIRRNHQYVIPELFARRLESLRTLAGYGDTSAFV
jgi:hypothetical protein